jgi:lipopolysaccharide export system permease protein
MVLAQQGSKQYISPFFTIYKYILLEFIFSFTVSFLFFFFIFFINQLLLMAEEILSKNVSLIHVGLIVLYSLPAIIAFALPFASLVGGLMSIGRLSSDNEILAMQASGISYRRIFVPILIIGVLLSIFSFIVSDYFLPVSTIKFGRLYREILYSSPELELESYSIKRYQDSILITGNVENRTINDLIIIDKTEDKNNRIILAKESGLVSDLDSIGVTSLELNNVLSLTPVLKQRGDFNYFTSKKMIYNILLKNISFSIRNLTPREMSSIDVYNSIRQKEEKQNNSVSLNERQIETQISNLLSMYNSENISFKDLQNTYNDIINKSKKIFTDRNLQIYRIEFNKKFAVPIACLIFLYFSFPISLSSRKSGKTMGFGIGLFVSIFYWSLLFTGQTLGIRMNFPPFISMWFPNFVIFTLGTLFMFLRFRR